ncbi:MAG: nucleotidyltransferase family protein [Desulfobacterales bacterium]|nr:nucleotidyltransferase family protein [Desulfobacterales bacterium]
MKKDLSFYARASQNLIFIHHLKGLIERLKKGGPEILFFRGMSLLGDVYPSAGEREMLDVDILVRERDLGILKKVLKSTGLKETGPGTFDKTGLSLDLHTSFLNPSRTILEHSCLRISIDDVFKRSVTKELDGIKIKIPCPEHLFISTAIHFQSHSFDSEKGWEDLLRIKKYYALSDEEILTEAKQMGAERTPRYLNALRPALFPAWRGKLSFGDRWILTRIKRGRFNQNFGDLLFLFQSKRKVKALQEIFFPRGISLKVIGNRLRKCFKLLKDTFA